MHRFPERKRAREKDGDQESERKKERKKKTESEREKGWQEGRAGGRTIFALLLHTVKSKKKNQGEFDMMASAH